MYKILLAEDETYILEAEINCGTWLMHFTALDFSLSIAKHWLSDWEEIKGHLRRKGLKEVYTCIPKGDNKLQKFQEMFGFRKLLSFNDCILYKQEI